MNPTIYDVSKLSGVSTATVSRAYSTPDLVKASTRSKVLDAAAVLNYSPNAIARAMVRQRTDRIAFLICKKHSSILDEFYAGVCEGIMRESNRFDYQLLISTADDWTSASSTAKRKQIDGVILGGNAQPDLISEFQNQNTAIVLVNNRVPGKDLPCVVSDEYGGVKLAVEHLLHKGHRKIAMMAGRFSPYISGERYNAFIDIMKQKGQPIEARYIKLCDPTLDSAMEAATELLSQPDPPTAVFGSNDIIATGVIKAALRMKRRVPADVAVVGYDDSTLCRVTEPEMTSVHIERARMGELCVERLTTLLGGGGTVPQATVVPSTLVERGST